VIVRTDGPSKAIDLDLTFSCGQVFRWTKVEDGWVGVIGDSLVRLQQKEGRLLFQSSPPLPKSRITGYLRLDDNLQSILKELARDKEFRRIVKSIPGIRILRQDPWECLASFVCSRNCRVPMIRRIVRNVSERFGKRITSGEYVGYSFPEAEIVSQASLLDLASCGFRYGRRQARELKELARLICKGEIDFDGLKNTSYAEAKARLMSFDHGVGNKVADCVLLFSLEKLESFPVDVWVARAVIELYRDHLRSDLASKIAGGQSLTPKEYREISDFGRSHFGRYAGYAQEYIYHWKRLKEGVC
jgi:N-glycosylase/DNA lyase